MEPTLSKARAFLKRLKLAVERDRVAVSQYAADRASEELEWTRWDILEQLKELAVNDLRRCEVSRAPTADLIWVFTPETADDVSLWIRLLERDGIVVVSFHKA